MALSILPSVPDDRGVGQQASHVARAEASHLDRVEPCEGAPESLALAKDGEPGEAGLKPLQAQLLVEPCVIAHRECPLLIVVA